MNGPASNASAERADYLERVRAGLRQIGKTDGDFENGKLGIRDLAPVDQFHVRGLTAIEDLIAACDVEAGARVVDISCGTGGPARVLASTSGIHVTGYDLNPVSVEAGNQMSVWTGMSDRVDLHIGNATDLPADNATFDGAWSVHVGMFVEDKAAFYAEAFRVLRPGGWLSIFDPVIIGGTDHSYPVPWAKDRATNYALTADGLTDHLKPAGFIDVNMVDRSEAAMAWFAEQRAAREAANAKGRGYGPPPLGLHLLVGPRFGEMTMNAAKALSEGKIGFAELHARKPA